MHPTGSLMTVTPLTRNDIDALLSLEAACYAPCLQASRETLEKRFDLGHIMLGAFIEGVLVGVASFAYRWFDSREAMKHFGEREWRPFYQLEMPARYNTVLIYNVEMLPEKRSVSRIYGLLDTMMQRAYEDGCRHLIGISRVPSYHGDVFNNIHAKPTLKQAIDVYVSGGDFPALEMLTQDPLVALYQKVGRCDVLGIASNYMPEDRPSGGIRAIVHTELDHQWERRSKRI
jgi:hypothetical protein